MFNAIDMHCDTIPGIMFAADEGKVLHIDKSTQMVDLEKMRRGNILLQCFSLFTELEYVKSRGETPYEHVQKLVAVWKSEIGAHPDRIRQVKTIADLNACKEAGLMGALMTVEEGAVYEGSIENLHALYEEGVRMSTLTWNYENELAYPNPHVKPGEKPVADTLRGLKKKGFEFIEEMQRLGIVIDMAHLNDAGIRDVLAHVKGPVISSHSNCRAVCNHLRNLTDEHIRGIAEHGGIIGANFFPAFLKEDCMDPVSGTLKASVTDMVRHMQHMKKIGGIECIGIGSDFDGYDGSLEIKDCSDMQLLADAMSLGGFTSGEIEQVFSLNAIRVFGEIWR